MFPHLINSQPCLVVWLVGLSSSFPFAGLVFPTLFLNEFWNHFARFLPIFRREFIHRFITYIKHFKIKLMGPCLRNLIFLSLLFYIPLYCFFLYIETTTFSFFCKENVSVASCNSQTLWDLSYQ